MGRKASDLTGGGYGRWTVIRKSGVKRNGNVCWDCYCDPERGGCGFYTLPDSPINGAALREGTSLSCGCLRNERSGKAAKKRSKQSRNAAILQWIDYGVPRPEVAKKFKLSKQRVFEIYRREKEST